MTKVTLRESPIQGKGVYAITNINEGDVILDIDDSHVVTDPSTLTDKQNEFDCDYLADGTVVLMQEPEKYINHSCDPSAYVKTVQGIRKVLAMHDIKSGEEVTYDYTINGDNEGTFECKCGSNNCRRIYNGNFFKLPLKNQLKYLPYLDDWFIKEHALEIEN